MVRVRSHVREVKQARMKGPFRRALMGCEMLESRRLLTIDMELGVCLPETSPSAMFVAEASQKVDGETKLPAATHQYLVDGEAIPMHVHPTRIALSLGAAPDAAQALAASGYTFVRQAGPDFSVYESNGSRPFEELLTRGIAIDSLPVFVLQPSNSEAVVVDELIVSLQPGTDPEAYFGDHPSFSAYRRLDGTPNQFIATVAGGKGEKVIEVLNELQASSDPAVVQWVAPNFYQNWQKFFTPNDPRFGNQWHLHNTGQGGGLVDADSDLPEAWDINQGGSADYVVGLLDDGIAPHADLNLWVNPGEIPGNGIDDDGNGWIDDVNGWNFVGNNNLSGVTTEADEHGTAVAGVAAARGNNGIGVAGASFNSMVLSTRMFEGSNVASDAGISSAIYYLSGRTADGLGTWKSADVANHSWGGGGTSPAISDAYTWGTSAGRLGLGTPHFVSSGNTFGAISFPANRTGVTPGLFAVGATNNRGTRSDYSAFGTLLDFVAPSDDTRVGYLTIDTTDREPFGYAFGEYTGIGATGFGGTSSSSPLAAGIGALVLDQADDLGVVLSAADLKSYLQNATDLIAGVNYDAATGKHLEYGFGRLNARTAVEGIGKAEISVLSPTTDLVSGSAVASVGSTYLDEFVDRSFRIRNQGTSTLELTNLSIAAGSFSILSGFGDASLALGESTTFTIRFAPTVAGTETAMVTILSNDTDEGTFTFNVTGTAIAPAIGGFVVEDWNGNGSFDPQDVPLAGRIVYLDANNNGLYDTDLGTTTYVNNTPTPLADVAVTNSIINVAGFAGAIGDVNVTLNITHTWNADLDVALISPTGVRVQLFNDVGGSSDNFINTVLDDEAATAITSGTAPFTGSFRPVQPLSAFDGSNANGNWTLEITDDAAGDVGTLNSWSLDIAAGEESITTRANGAYVFETLPAGTYTLRALAPAGWEEMGDNVHVVEITSPTDSFRGRNFGIAKNDRFYGIVFDDINADGVFDATEMPLAGRTLFFDVNGNEVLDAPATSSHVESPAALIPDNSTVNFTTAITGLTSPILDVNVRVNITMTFNADLEVFLVHPDGTRVELFTNVGGASDNFTDTILDDSAASSIASGTGPFAGSFRPEGVLATLNDKFANGTWTLEVSDVAGGDVARLNEWELILVTGEPSALTNSVGVAYFDLPADSPNDIYLADLAGWAPTLPTDGLRTVTTTGVPLVNQLFGSTMSASDVIPPTVGMSVVGSTTWPADFLDFVDGAGNNGLGMELVPGMLPLVFNDIDRLYIQFSEAVTNVSASNFELRNSSELVPFNLAYDPVTFVATIELANPLPANKYRLAASNLITDMAGNALDGTGMGGVYDLRFDVLPGDANGDRRVNGADLAPFAEAFNTAVGSPNYNLRVDWNADGRVNGNDLGVLSANFNGRIDNLTEPAAPFGGGQSPFRFSMFDSFFKDLGEEDDDEKEDGLLTSF